MLPLSFCALVQHMADPIDDALNSPKRVKTQTAEVEARTADELIALDRYAAAKQAARTARRGFYTTRAIMPDTIGPRPRFSE